MDNTYAEIGVEVILREHIYQPWHSYIPSLEQSSAPDMVRRNWRTEQNQYIGKKARITRLLFGYDFSGCKCCKVDIDGGRHEWRVESMILASEEELMRENG